MSDSAEKHFEPTQSRLAKAKREGDFPRSSELGGNTAFAGSAIAACVVAPAIGALTCNGIAVAANGRTPFTQAYAIMALALVPIAAGNAAAIVAGLVQLGGLRAIPNTLKFERMNPVEGFKRMISRETVTHGVRACIAFVVAASAIVPTLRDVLAASGAPGGARAIAAVAWVGAQHVVAATLAIGGCFALAEYGVARTSWLKNLRMSFAEFKREMKESDGDPLLRSRRKALHRTLVRGALSRVKDASFVVVNPTHIAIALDYRPPEVAVPMVLVRAADDGALRVRELAAQHGVPVIENIPLARALFADAHVGAPISHVHYVAVAEIVAALTRSGALV